MKANLKFKKSCQRIAICLYGQYRSGDYVLPYFKTLSEQTDCVVDFFCSTKEQNYYKFSRSATVHNKDMDNIQYVDEEIIKKKIIASGINAKTINVLSNSADEKFREADVERNGLFYTMADSINLKTLYEAEHGFVYDIVLLTRYDALIGPIDMLEYLKTWYNTATTNTFEKDFSYSLMNNWLIANPLTINQDLENPTTGLQDILTIGSSVSMDMISTELSMIMQGNLNPKASKPILAEQFCGHSGLNYAVHSAGIGFSSDLGRIDSRTNEYVFQGSHEVVGPKYRKKGIQYTLIRETWNIEELLKKIPFEHPMAMDFYSRKWHGDRLNPITKSK
jgi:hypothetical protein